MGSAKSILVEFTKEQHDENTESSSARKLLSLVANTNSIRDYIDSNGGNMYVIEHIAGDDTTTTLESTRTEETDFKSEVSSFFTVTTFNFGYFRDPSFSNANSDVKFSVILLDANGDNSNKVSQVSETLNNISPLTAENLVRAYGDGSETPFPNKNPNAKMFVLVTPASNIDTNTTLNTIDSSVGGVTAVAQQFSSFYTSFRGDTILATMGNATEGVTTYEFIGMSSVGSLK